MSWQAAAMVAVIALAMCATRGDCEAGAVAVGTGQNVCTNGGFESLEQAAGPLPKAWSEYLQGPTARVEVSDDACEGRRSLRLIAQAGDVVGANSAVMALGRGVVRFGYKVLASDADAGNLALYVIGLSGPAGGEVVRHGYSPPREHARDGQWHEASFEFDFSDRRIKHCLIAPRINETTTRTGDGDWLIDAVEVYPIRTGARITLANVWSDKPLARTGDRIRFSAWVENTGDEEASQVSLQLEAPEGITCAAPAQIVRALPAVSYERVDWELVASKATAAEIRLTAALEGDAAETRQASYKVLVVDREANLNRQELVTDEVGYWRLLPRPTTLQERNRAPLAPIRHKRSSEIKRSPYGICAHLPRSRDYEAPFDPVHLIDDDPETCWSSQQRASPYPGRPPWVEIDLGRVVTVTQINLIPYWRNTDFPIGFSVRTSSARRRWSAVLRVKDHMLADSGERRGDKMAQAFPLGRRAKARYVRVEFERLPLSGGNYAEVSQGYKARLSGIEVVDDEGGNVALAARGATVTVSDAFTGWHNTARTVNESFSRIFDLGVKWVRVGQWGDQTEWAAVEREQGEFRMDAATDAAIQKLADNGVDILWGLQYGNALHDRPENPVIDIGPIYTEGHPFYLNWGPRTAAGRRAFVRYVDFVVRKYKDRIKFWELWNEENGWYPFHEPELYGKLLLAVSRRIKSIDPDLTVVFGGTAAPAPSTTEIALREGAAPYVDAYAFHPYGIDKPEGGMGTMEFYQGQNLSQSREQTGWNRLEDIVAGVKQPFAQHGRPDVGVWLNEWGTNVAGLGYSYKPGIGEYGCAKYLIRFYVYSGWVGLRTAWWALYNENMSQDWGVIDPHDYSFRPPSYALRNVCSVVSDVEPIRELAYRCDGAAPDLKVISYHRDNSNEMLVLVWAAEMFNEEVKAYPSRLSFALKSRPTRVTLTDLYWGVSQPAVWSYNDGTLTVDGLVVRDYPIVISCR
ncbi:MAG: discoidin domain-containing protein [Armatimonadota bacterium]|nr:MAG: discoidin domain-containing protein [Armatimonadota bacterium]